MLDRDLGSRSYSPEQQRYHRSFSVVLEGQPSQKIVEGGALQVVPSLLVDRKGSNFFLGVSIPDQGTTYHSLWGEYPEVVHGWRALKLLEALPEVDNMNLFATWQITHHDQPSTQYEMGKIAHLFGGMEQLTALRNEIMQSGPTSDEVQSIINASEDAGAKVEGWELKREAEAGFITITPHIQEIIDEAERRSEEATAHFARIKAEMAIPLPEEESLSRLLQQLEIGTVVVGMPFGAYGMDWDFTPAEKVDDNLRSSSYWGDSWDLLYHPTEVPTFKKEQLSPGVTMTTPGGGEIVKLTWTDPSTGVKVNSVEAKFSDGKIRLRLKLERPNGEIEESESTVPEFRERFELPL